MWKDPIVERIHRYREAYAKKFNYDVWAIYEDLKVKEQLYAQQGWRMVSRCAKEKEEKEEKSTTE